MKEKGQNLKRFLAVAAVFLMGVVLLGGSALSAEKKSCSTNTRN